MEKSEIGNVVIFMHKGDSILIGDDIEILVMASGSNNTGKGVRLRISAPKVQKILRVKNDPPSKL